MLNVAPVFSIIIPTYNSEATLDAALTSIVNQSFKNFEVLIIDGLSTDATLGIATRYQTQFSGIRIISEKDQGIYDAMNKGIALAKGTWLYFMGSDDTLYAPTTLEQVIESKALEGHEVVYGDVYSKYFNGRYDGSFTYAKVFNQNICHQSIFFKKDVFNKTGLFNLKYKAYADWHHNIKWFFSSNISNSYVNLIIAHFTYGGFSAVHDDKSFKSDRIFFLIFKGIGKLNNSELLKACNNYINYAKGQPLFFRLLFAYFFKIILIFSKKITPKK